MVVFIWSLAVQLAMYYCIISIDSCHCHTNYSAYSTRTASETAAISLCRCCGIMKKHIRFYVIICANYSETDCHWPSHSLLYYHMRQPQRYIWFQNRLLRCCWLKKICLMRFYLFLMAFLVSYDCITGIGDGAGHKVMFDVFLSVFDCVYCDIWQQTDASRCCTLYSCVFVLFCVYFRFRFSVLMMFQSLLIFGWLDEAVTAYPLEMVGINLHWLPDGRYFYSQDAPIRCAYVENETGERWESASAFITIGVSLKT